MTDAHSSWTLCTSFHFQVRSGQTTYDIISTLPQSQNVTTLQCCQCQVIFLSKMQLSESNKPQVFTFCMSQFFMQVTWGKVSHMTFLIISPGVLKNCSFVNMTDNPNSHTLNIAVISTVMFQCLISKFSTVDVTDDITDHKEPLWPFGSSALFVNNL